MENLKKPKLSPDFTMDDLYKLREYNSIRWFNMSSEEMIADIKKVADQGIARIEKIRESKKLILFES